MKKIVTVIVLVVMVTILFAAPFGLKKYTKKTDVIITEDGEGGSIFEVPKPHSMFETYIGNFNEAETLVRVLAVTEEFTTNNYGTTIKSKFNSIKEALDKKYGAGLHVNYLKDGSIWDEPKDFLMALSKEEYVLLSTWFPNEGDITGISLVVAIFSSNSAVLMLNYELDGWQEHINSEKADDDSGL